MDKTEYRNNKDNLRFIEHVTSFVELVKQEIWTLVSISAPILLSFLFQFGMGITDNGHIGADELAAASLANTWMWATSSPAIGLSFALDTLISQAYGAKNFRLVGIQLQNALFVEGLICIPILIIWLFTKELLMLMFIEEKIATMCATFVHYVTPSIFATMTFNVVMKYLQNQQITKPGLICNGVGFVLNIFLDWLFVFGLGWGFEGAAIATTISKFMQPVWLISYIMWRGLHKKTWFGWSREMVSLSRLKAFFRFGSASALMFWFEVLGFEISTFVVGELHSSSLLSAHSIAFGFLLMSFVVPLGLGIGTSVRVGNLLGEGFPTEAKNAAKVATFLTACCMVFNGTVVISFRTLLVKLYTNDEQISDISSNLLYFVAACTFCDGMQTLFGCTLRGAGHPMIGTIVNLVGYHGVATPLYFVTALVFGWGLYGIWGSMCLGLSVIAIGNSIAVSRIDWEKESVKARERSMETKPNFEILDESDTEETEAINLADLEEEGRSVIQPRSYEVLVWKDQEVDEIE